MRNDDADMIYQNCFIGLNRPEESACQYIYEEMFIRVIQSSSQLKMNVGGE
jgi:hypothetical protein